MSDGTINLPLAGTIIRENNVVDLLNNQERLDEMRRKIGEGASYVVASGIKPKTIDSIKQYLKKIGLGSLPNYQKIEQGSPNYHRVNYWDDRAFVGGCFHQFAFFPWNQDVFNLFGVFNDVFRLKNLLSGLPEDKFMGAEPEDGCTARLAFQFYPKGVGALNKHIDPVNHHQLTVPVMLMSQKGEDFESGGLYIESQDKSRIVFDDIGKPGDIIFFNAQIAHGVDHIDPDVDVDWPSFEGRWMALFAVNKLADNASVQDSVDLGAA